MKKLANIRSYLNEKIPYLKQNPDNLYLFVENGRIIATLANSGSFEYEYTLNIIIERFSGDQNILFAVIVDWLRRHQSDTPANPNKRENNFSFESVILDNDTANISIDLKLTERVTVKTVNGKQFVEAIPEPDNPFEQWPE